MAKSKAKKSKTPSPKKQIRQQIIDKLRIALADLEDKLGKKELESRIKKTAKLFTSGIKIKPTKPAKTKKVKEGNTSSDTKPE